MYRAAHEFLDALAVHKFQKVSGEWRRFLLRELRPALFSRIRNLQIVETKKTT